MAYYEDFEMGQKGVSPGRTVTDGMATALINIGGFVASQFNDEIEANKTPLGWRALPGRIVFALMGGLVEQMGVFGGPGPAMLVGADKLTWKSPVRVGDTIHLEWRVTEMRKTRNPRWGLVSNKETLINQRGEPVCEVEMTHLLEYRPT
jgi:acyl dehydratase